MKGAYVIAVYGALLSLELLATLRFSRLELPRLVTIAAILFAAGTAVYTAFLFGQAKGRDLWQSPILAPHLIVQAMTAGAALFKPAWLFWLVPLDGLLIAGEIYGRHPTEDGRRAVRRSGPSRQAVSVEPFASDASARGCFYQFHLPAGTAAASAKDPRPLRLRHASSSIGSGCALDTRNPHHRISRIPKDEHG